MLKESGNLRISGNSDSCWVSELSCKERINRLLEA